MQNFPLLEEAGNSKVPILLKRGMMATLDEYLHAAEYILARGNNSVILCERGIRTFDTSTRYTLDLNAIPVLKQLTHLPVIVDPSHGTGSRELVPAMSKAALAAGADGLLVEVHHRPDEALCDGSQSLYPEEFARMVGDLQKIAEAVGRHLI
jgi:3-deoxy-7-phosphoheptulonate synthase